MKPSTIVLLLAAGLGVTYFILRSKKAKQAMRPGPPPAPTSSVFNFLPPSPLRPAAPGMAWTRIGDQWVEMPAEMG